MSYEIHRAKSPQNLRIAVVTISDKRAKGEPDISGDIAEGKLTKTGWEVVREIVPNDKQKIREVVEKYMRDVDVIVTIGGTGITSRDLTIETIRPLLEKELPGFGEMLRHLGYQKIGTPALLSRALAGARDGKLIFCLPGAPNAVAIGLDLILPDLPHLLKHARE